MIITITARCKDQCTILLPDGRETSGYVPDMLERTSDGSGDAVHIQIDTSTGQIVGWSPMTDTEVLEELGYE